MTTPTPDALCGELEQLANFIDPLLIGGKDERLIRNARDLIQQQQATIERLSAEKVELLNDIAVMMSEFVDNWPQPKKVSTALALIAKTLRAALGKDAK